MIKDELHIKICENFKKLNLWFDDKSKNFAFPFYSSYDIRESEFKVAPVDANIFPAGFNNICSVDQESAVDKVKDYFESHYPGLSGTIALVTEAHTKNAYYWQNVYTIYTLLQTMGLAVKIAIPSEEKQEAIKVESISGNELEVNFIYKHDSSLLINGEKPDFIISNNDFSVIFEDWKSGIEQPMNPPYELGWYQRRKSQFFMHYNELAIEFADIIGANPEHLTVHTDAHKNFDINSEESRESLALKVDSMITSLSDKYTKTNIKESPFVFIKNSSGTYGMGIQQVASGDEVRSWTYKARKKMKAVKGGGSIDELVVQEGIPTVFSDSDETAEPAIYMIGGKLAGGFLRAHSQKGPRDNLNSPGAIYKKLCISDLKVRKLECPMENVYGWVAKLGSVAIATEAKKANINFKNYKY